MAVIVTATGILIVLLGAIGVVNPHTLSALVDRWSSPARFRFGVGLRLALGFAFLAVAPDCRHPLVVQIVGGVSLVVALSTLVVGRERVDVFIAWVSTRQPALLRLWAVGPITFGVLLVYAGP